MKRWIRCIRIDRLTHHVWKRTHGIVRHELHHRIEISRVTEGHVGESAIHPVKPHIATIHSLHLHSVLILRLL